MASFLAQAFVNGDIYGILCSLDAMIDPNCWYETILHEMTHIYCKKHESNGEDFFQKYCVDEEKGTGVSGEMAAGYAVWSEFIAYYLGAELDPFSNPLSMSQVRKEIRKLDVDVDGTNPEAKMIVSQMLAHIFRNPEICNAGNVAAAVKIIEKNEIFESMEQANSLQSLIEIIFKQLHKKACWEITPGFIDDVGSAYLMMLARRFIPTRQRTIYHSRLRPRRCLKTAPDMQCRAGCEMEGRSLILRYWELKNNPNFNTEGYEGF